MTYNFVAKVIESAKSGKMVKHGKYIYYVQYHPMVGRNCIIRCPRDKVGKTKVTRDAISNGVIETGSYWEFVW